MSAEFDPDWFLTEEQKGLRAELIETCEAVIRPQAIKSDQTGEYPWASIEALAKLNLLGAIVPKKYNGRGENHVGAVMLLETLARYGCPSTSVIYMMHLAGVAGLLFRAGGNAAAQDILSRLDRDVLIGSASYTDPETGGHFWFPKISNVEKTEKGWHVVKKSSFTTSSGYAKWMITQTTSPNFDGDYSNLSVFLLMDEELQGAPDGWNAMGMRGTKSGPVKIDVELPADRMIGPPGDGAASNDEAIDPVAMVAYGGLYNGISLAALDLAKDYTTKRKHAQFSQSVADYPTTHDVFGGSLNDVEACRLMAYSLARQLDAVTENGDWTLHERDPKAMPRTPYAPWCFMLKELACRHANDVSDKMLHLFGGAGYSKHLEIERVARDSKAGWVMGPSNEVSRQLVGRWALLGSEAVDWWNQRVNEGLLNSEISKLDDAGKRALADKLTAELREAAAETAGAA
ncbi:acyl-CoA dehydrogenase family protein [Methyloligella sp. GL2]|uniref:acyl-CoA dehydrogenase family protein n=1 Tax=Methyloligella sp. GL2 TaxID=2742204 RepID=UPI001FEF231F|nr:acyl-CoA dehydrogenase family protein [Methyloligella sp. GL2]